MENKRILLNCIQTPDGTKLISRHRHDYVTYIDKKNNQHYSVDGGIDDLRRGCDKQDYKELSVYDDGKHSTRRKYLYWGVNYDKHMKKLKQTEWKAIKDLDTEHIENILKIPNIDSFYKEVLKRELLYRENKNL